MTADLVDKAREALQTPPDFGARDDRLFVTHAPVIGQTRDADAIEVSNFDAVAADLLARYGEASRCAAVSCGPDCQCGPDVFVGRVGHWAVGWVDLVWVRVLLDAAGTDGTRSGERFCEENIAPSFRAGMEWAARVESAGIVDPDGHWRVLVERVEEMLECDGIPRELGSSVAAELYLVSELELGDADLLGVVSEWGSALSVIREHCPGQLDVYGNLFAPPDLPADPQVIEHAMSALGLTLD